eukprot:gene2997-1979_t
MKIRTLDTKINLKSAAHKKHNSPPNQKPHQSATSNNSNPDELPCRCNTTQPEIYTTCGSCHKLTPKHIFRSKPISSTTQPIVTRTTHNHSDNKPSANITQQIYILKLEAQELISRFESTPLCQVKGSNNPQTQEQLNYPRKPVQNLTQSLYYSNPPEVKSVAMLKQIISTNCKPTHQACTQTAPTNAQAVSQSACTLPGHFRIVIKPVNFHPRTKHPANAKSSGKVATHQIHRPYHVQTAALPVHNRNQKSSKPSAQICGTLHTSPSKLTGTTVIPPGPQANYTQTCTNRTSANHTEMLHPGLYQVHNHYIKTTVYYQAHWKPETTHPTKELESCINVEIRKPTHQPASNLELSPIAPENPTNQGINTSHYIRIPDRQYATTCQTVLANQSQVLPATS